MTTIDRPGNADPVRKSSSPGRAGPGPQGGPIAPRPAPPSPIRLGIASVGALAVVGMVATSVLVLLGPTPFLVPLACLVVAALAVVLLRTLAVRSRRKRVDRALAEAMGPSRPVATDAAGPSRTSQPSGSRRASDAGQVPSTPQIPSAPAAPAAAVSPRRAPVLFDAEEERRRPLAPMDRRRESLAGVPTETPVKAPDTTASSAPVPPPGTGQDAASPIPSEDHAVPTIETIETDGRDVEPAGATAWAPVSVPRPTYVDAVRAEREAPAPLDLPEAPSSATPLKAGESARAAEASPEQSPELPLPERIDLDDVLQRRRA